MLTSTQFTDTVGDVLSIEGDHNIGEITLVAVEKSTWVSGTETSQRTLLEFTPAESIRIAEDLLRRAGKTPVEPLRGLVTALSFNEAMFRLAAEQHRTVTFRYAKDDGKYIEARRLNPESITADGKGVLGRDPDRDDGIRRFNLDRVKGEVSFA